MNPGLESLQPYPFDKLRLLFAGIETTCNRISLSIGEPQHAPPKQIAKVFSEHSDLLARYPTTEGRKELRAAIASWLTRRFRLVEADPEINVLPLNGTREGLFAIAQTIVTPGIPGRVVCPNPFYQIYEGAALLAGTRPVFVNSRDETGFRPDFDSVTCEQWQTCQLLYLCTPGNPSGAVLSSAQLQDLILLAHEYDFVIASDECYSEIYTDETNPPPGLLQASAEMGNTDFSRCLCFHSLSKRSNLPGLRSGFVAGDAQWIARFKRYRSYHGCAMPLIHQLASEWAWSEEEHVINNRTLYREKFAGVAPILEKVMKVSRPEASFYLWPETPIDDENFARELLQRTGVSVLPGSYLARMTSSGNPGAYRVRMALVAEYDQCIEAAERIARSLQVGW